MTLAQERLRRFGYEPGPIDGVMRFETASALRAFQRAHGLSVGTDQSRDLWPPLGSKTSSSDGGVKDRPGMNNCTDMVVATAALAGINLSHRIGLTVPPEAKSRGRTLRVWTDPPYRVLKFSAPEVLEVDLRQLVRGGNRE